MQKIEIGRPYRFTPSAFTAEKEGVLGGKAVLRKLTGTIVWINVAHRFFLVTATLPNGYTVRECFHFFRERDTE